MKVKLFVKLIAGFLVAGILPLFVISGIFYVMSTKNMEKMAEAELRRSMGVVEECINEHKGRMAMAGMSITTAEGIIPLIYSKNKKELKKISLKYMQDGGYDSVTFTDYKGNVIVRGHNDKAGDSLAAQENIKSAMNGKSGIFLEDGNTVKFVLKGGFPIMDGNKVAGIVTIGQPIASDNFVDQMKRALGTECTVFYGDERKATTVIKEGKRAVGTKLGNPVIEKKVLEKGEVYVGKNVIVGKQYSTVYWPIRYANGNIAGMFFLGIPRATVLANAKALQFQTSFYAAAGTTTANLWIDDVQLYGCTAACPVPPTSTPTTGTGATSTYTNTIPAATATFTNTPPVGATSTHTSTNTNTTIATATFTNTAIPTITVTAVTVIPGTGTITVPAVGTVTVQFTIQNQTANSVTIRLVDSTLTPVGTLIVDTTPRVPGTYSINITDFSALTGLADGAYSIQVVATNLAWSQSSTTTSGLRTWDMLSGATATLTNTTVPTATFTSSNTAIPTSTFTYTLTNTPTGPTATSTPTDVPGAITVSNVALPDAVMSTLDLVSPLIDGMEVSFTIGVETGDRVIIQVIPKNGAFPVVNYVVPASYTPGNYFVIVPESMFASVPQGLYDIVVKAENTANGHYDIASLASQYITNNLAIPSYTPTVVPTQGSELKIPEDSILPYPNPANGGDVNIKFALTKNAKTITFKLYTSASRLVRQVELPVDKINMGIKSLTAGDNIVTIPAESFKDTANGTYYYVVIVKDDKGNTAKSKVDKIIIIKGKTAK